MEIEVGEYVRNKEGKIIKATWVGQAIVTNDKYTMSKLGGEITKHSKNIIDLIEEGDYVNGEYVAVIEKDKNGNITDICYEEENEGQLYSIGDIETVVTKEQFAQMEYKVEE